MSTATDKDLDALTAEMKQLRSEFSKLGELLRNTARHAGDEATDAARAAGERVWAETKGKAEDLVGRIEEKPVTAAAWAFGIGILLGLLFGRR